MESTFASEHGPVRRVTEGDVAVLVIDNPPVNASTADVRAGLQAGVRAAAEDDNVRAVVLIGAGRHFISGSDLVEFGAERLPEPQLPEVIDAIERCPKPVVAALSGATLGGGFELALGCDARIAGAGGVVGFPEIDLGMIPGAGGTQRTQRLVPPSRVLELVTSGTRLPVERAGEEGLVDEVVAGDELHTHAVQFARRLDRKRVLSELPVLEEPVGRAEAAARKALARGGPRPEVGAAVAAVLAGAALPADEALARERSEFHRLRTGRPAAARRHAFFARTSALKAAKAQAGDNPQRIGVVGAGTMGTGITRAFLQAGVPVTLVDTDEEAVRRATAVIEPAAGRSPHPGHGQLLGVSTELSALAAVDLVVEAVFEDADVKAAVLKELEATVGPHTGLATNTSYLDLDELASCLADPTRLVGAHFFAPAHRSAVLEVVRGPRTSAEALAGALGAARSLGKLPLVAGAGEGFIGNRIYNTYRTQCEFMVEEGAAPEQVDAALRAFGFAMGPFAVSDMSGLDIAWRMRKAKAARRDPRARYPYLPDRLCELGRLGQKTGAGWYRYEPGSRTPVPDAAVTRIVDDVRAERSVEQREFTDDGIVMRALTALANEAALVLEDGIARTPGDIDLLFTLAYGFPAHEGGIAFWATGQPVERLREEQQRLAQVTGHGFRAGDFRLLAQ